MMKYKCTKCKNELEWDENCNIEEGLGYYYCSNDDCESNSFSGSAHKVYYPTGEVWYE